MDLKDLFATDREREDVDPHHGGEHGFGGVSVGTLLEVVQQCETTLNDVRDNVVNVMDDETVRQIQAECEETNTLINDAFNDDGYVTPLVSERVRLVEVKDGGSKRELWADMIPGPRIQAGPPPQGFSIGTFDDMGKVAGKEVELGDNYRVYIVRKTEVDE